MDLRKEKREIEEWNNAFSVGQRVLIKTGLNSAEIGYTSTPAYMSDVDPVIRIKGRLGHYLLSVVRPIADDGAIKPRPVAKLKYVRRPAAQLYVIGGN